LGIEPTITLISLIFYITAFIRSKTKLVQIKIYSIKKKKLPKNYKNFHDIWQNRILNRIARRIHLFLENLLLQNPKKDPQKILGIKPVAEKKRYMKSTLELHVASGNSLNEN
jgi:hypothetical protein